MYKITGFAFCLLEGVLIASYGWIALLWSPIGFIVGIFITSQIVLPLILGLPLAFSLVSKKQMRSKVFLALFRTPIIWVIQLLIIGFLLFWFWHSAIDWLYVNQTLNIGIAFGFIAILLSPISKKVRADFRVDFDKAWGKYYTSYMDNNEEFEKLASYTDKKQSKQVEAAIKVFSNLYIHTTTSTEESDSKFKLLPDSRHRYMIFCMSTFINCSEDIIYDRDSFISDCIHFISLYMTSKENVEEFFNGKVNLEEAKQRGNLYLKEFLNNWTAYYNAIKIKDNNLATSILCNMMHSTVTNETLKQADKIGLEEMASETVNLMPAMRNAFINSLK